MANVIFTSFNEEAAKGSGLVSETLKGGGKFKIIFESPWTSKDGHTRTRGGKGSLGVNTSLGWMDASSLIKYLDKVQERHGLIKENKTGNKVTSYELVCDGVTVFEIESDKSGKIIGIKK